MAVGIPVSYFAYLGLKQLSGLSNFKMASLSYLASLAASSLQASAAAVANSSLTERCQRMGFLKKLRDFPPLNPGFLFFRDDFFLGIIQ